MNPRNKSAGYIALLAVLIVGAASLAIALAVLTSGTDNQRITLVNQQSIQARALADACAEEALQQIHDNYSFIRSSTLTLGQGSCTYSVTDTGTGGRDINTSGTVNSIVRKTKIHVTISASSISITSWQEI